MNQEAFIQKCLQLTGNETAEPHTPDSLIGLFQCFRPDGKAIASIFTDMAENEELVDRMEELFQAAGNDQRPDGGRDAYFVVRRPSPLEPQHAETLGLSWIKGLHELAKHSDQPNLAPPLEADLHIRVLEGIPPKHPKNEAEQANLLRCVRQCGEVTSTLSCAMEANALRPAYYFIACDPLLRDYLMWPFFRQVTGLADPLQAYFQLWRHGVKYRIFEESQIDLYLPRQL